MPGSTNCPESKLIYRRTTVYKGEIVMNNLYSDSQSTAEAVPQKRSVLLPIVALTLDFSPLALFGLISLLNALDIEMSSFAVFIFLLMVLMPVAGMMSGIASLCIDKYKGAAGKIIAVIAIAFPIVFVVSVILLLQTGAIVFSM